MRIVLAQRQLLSMNPRRTHSVNARSATSAPVAFYRIEPSGGLPIVWISDQITRLTALPASYFADKPAVWIERIHPKDRPRVLRDLRTILQQDKFRAGYRWLHGDGTYHLIMDEAVLVRDSHGVPQEILGSWREIVRRKRESEPNGSRPSRQTSLIRLATRLCEQPDFKSALGVISEEIALALNATAVGIDLGSPDQQVLYASPTFGLDETRREQLQRVLFGSQGPANLLSWRVATVRAGSGLSGGSIVGRGAADSECRIISQELRWDRLLLGHVRIATVGKPGRRSANEEALLSALICQAAMYIGGARQREIDRLRVAELDSLLAQRTRELQDARAELGSVFRSVSHDLRAPLRALQGFATIIVEDYADDLPPDCRALAERVADSAGRMDVLLADLLAYSRVSQAELTLAPTSLERVIDDALVQLEASAVTCREHVYVEDRLPAVIGHHSVLVQVLTNLISNALKFVQPGVTPIVRVWAESRGEATRLWVEDNGIGISLEHAERIYEEFVRLNAQDTYPGSGIGLSIVRRALERIGGTTGVESVPGAGSRFWIELASAQHGH